MSPGAIHESDLDQRVDLLLKSAQEVNADEAMEVAAQLDELSKLLKKKGIRLLDAANMAARSRAIRAKFGEPGRRKGSIETPSLARLEERMKMLIARDVCTDKSVKSASGMEDPPNRDCPLCLETIKSEATTCKFCQSDLSVRLLESGRTQQRSTMIGMLVKPTHNLSAVEHKILEADQLVKQGRNRWKTGNHADALTLYHEALSQTTKLISNEHPSLGFLYFLIGSLEGNHLAENFLRKSIRLYEAADQPQSDSGTEAKAHRALAELLCREQRWQKAQGEMAHLLLLEPTRLHRFENLLKMAELCNRLDQQDKAEDYFDLVLQYSKVINSGPSWPIDPPGPSINPPLKQYASSLRLLGQVEAAAKVQRVVAKIERQERRDKNTFRKWWLSIGCVVLFFMFFMCALPKIILVMIPTQYVADGGASVVVDNSNSAWPSVPEIWVPPGTRLKVLETSLLYKHDSSRVRVHLMDGQFTTEVNRYQNATASAADVEGWMDASRITPVRPVVTDADKICPDY